MGNRLILASMSPRRCELLKQLGLDFKVIPSEIDEDIIPGESPREHVIRLAKAKALDVGSQYPEDWVIGADTIVYIDGIILGKPKNRGEAMEMLRLISGKEHRVLTGVSVYHHKKGKSECEAVETVVKVKSLTTDEMNWYINTGEPFDKAGGYGIQGIGSFMIESIKGSYTNVVGLPLCELIQILVRLKALTISEFGLRLREPSGSERLRISE
ncbi:MAG: septum formation inhibitor Maf [Deltaproteobacteria bacterium]|nr:septum formation inhibitor Maf [Deltaproteobacteria bacterium]MBM4322277.1 septum formation inhibitor Maf [Deltaproteobacteria bacterium]